MSKINALAEIGQSLWYDFIRRDLLVKGELQALIDQGIRGVTSNPAIFEKAIAGSTDYDQDLVKLSHRGLSAMAIYETMAIADIRLAADLLRQTYETSNFVDGYVSLEVDPQLAHDTEQTIAEAKRLFIAVDRPNTMIKVPATAAGMPAISALTAAGVNVNATLIFSIDGYVQVAEAYLEGVAKLAESGPRITGGRAADQIGSVASFFVSRLDTAVDQALDAMGSTDLQGQAAVANARLAYEQFQRIFDGPRWARLQSQGAHVQRVLWASTGTKNPDYSDTLYVDELIGPHTVNTLPPNTLKSFIDHGRVQVSVTRHLDDAKALIKELNKIGIDIDKVTRQLQTEGVDAFVKPFHALISRIEAKQKAILSDSSAN